MNENSEGETQSLRNANWIARRLGVSRWYVYELVKRGVLPHVRLGARVRFDEDGIEAFIRSGGTTGLEEPTNVKPLPSARSR